MKNSLRVLVIDDELQIRRFFDIGLRVEGYEVLQAETAAEGLALAATHAPDVVMPDLGLPDREGHEVLIGLRQWSKVPVSPPWRRTMHRTVGSGRPEHRCCVFTRHRRDAS